MHTIYGYVGRRATCFGPKAGVYVFQNDHLVIIQFLGDCISWVEIGKGRPGGEGGTT